MYVDFIFIIHSFIDGHLGCLHSLAVVNPTEESTDGARSPSRIQNPLGMCPVVIYMIVDHV